MKCAPSLLFFMAALWHGSRVAVSDFRSGLRRCKAQLCPIQLSDIIVLGVLSQLKLYFRVSLCQSQCAWLLAWWIPRVCQTIYSSRQKKKRGKALNVLTSELSLPKHMWKLVQWCKYCRFACIAARLKYPVNNLSVLCTLCLLCFFLVYSPMISWVSNTGTWGPVCSE